MLQALVFAALIALPAAANDRSAQPAGAKLDADLLNLFVVVEADARVSILDGDRFEPIHRIVARDVLRDRPKFTADGRYMFFASGDGWISKFALWNLAMVTEVHAGTGIRNLAVSSDGRYVALASHSPPALRILDANLGLLKVLPSPSPFSSVHDAPSRRSFVVALQDAAELWEVSYDPKAEPIAEGVVHDFRLKEGTFVEGFLNPRRTKLEEPLDSVFFAHNHAQVVGALRGGKRAQVVHLEVRRPIATLALSGQPLFGSGASWARDGRRLLAAPNARDEVVSIIDIADWRIVKHIPTLGPASFVRSHAATRLAWVDSMQHRDMLQMIDKETLEVVARLTPEAGKTLAHVEFDRHGRHALVGLAQTDGALIVFDANTLREVKRIPAKNLVGAYNVRNSINLE